MKSMIAASCLVLLSACTTTQTVYKLPQAPQALLTQPDEIIVAEDRLKGSTDFREFMSIVIENNRIMLKNLQQLKALQRWVKDSTEIYK